ncbi:Nmad5 family putative nucleotide modification protein [Pandoraea apista]|uniref:Nmad5 family putative nucleotide modification protein n=1 Tax=Pandoraea apista TaxID=93218 RepID=UPI000B8C4DD4|nr:Nmad5 family putative nucleotide modification protein [Pandoraea apista]OXS92659.1 hypothetical protein B7H01_17130 [Pandoraea apista]
MRLTNEMRTAIVRSAMKAAFNKREEAHNSNTVAFGDAVYAEEHGAVEKIARKLPPGWIQTAKWIGIECPGFSRRSNDGLKLSQIPMSVARPQPYLTQTAKITPSHPLYERSQAIADEHQAIRRDKEALEGKLKSIVNAASTVARLLDAWPECERFLPQTPTKSYSVVPLTLVADVNATLGIKQRSSRAART